MRKRASDSSNEEDSLSESSDATAGCEVDGAGKELVNKGGAELDVNGVADTSALTLSSTFPIFCLGLLFKKRLGLSSSWDDSELSSSMTRGESLIKLWIHAECLVVSLYQMKYQMLE